LILVLSSFLAAFVAVVLPGRAAACSCMSPQWAEVIATRDVIFQGTPVGRDESGAFGSGSAVDWAFDVDTVYKGEVTRRAVVVSAADGASCGVAFTLGRPYLVVSTGGDEYGFNTDLCSGTGETSQIPEAAWAALGAGSAPLPGGPSLDTPSPTTIFFWVAAGLVVIAVVAWMRFRRRRRPRFPG
jgi:hypothetical protein